MGIVAGGVVVVVGSVEEFLQEFVDKDDKHIEVHRHRRGRSRPGAA